MTAITVAAACVAGAMICAVIRPQRPELATAVSLAVGCAVMAAVAGQVRTEYLRYGALWNMFADRDGVGRVMLRAGGIAVVSELGRQLCVDAGETALAGRIALAARVAILALCLPLMASLYESLRSLA